MIMYSLMTKKMICLFTIGINLLSNTVTEADINPIERIVSLIIILLYGSEVITMLLILWNG